MKKNKSDLRSDKIFGYLFATLVFFIPTQLAYHFWPTWSFVYGIRVDYLSPTIYLSDIFLLILLSYWLIKRRLNFLKRKFLIVVLLLLVLLVINCLGAANFNLALVRWLKLLVLGFFGYLVASEKNFDLYKLVIRPLSLSIILVSLVGLGQFIKGSTLNGFFYFLGERRFSVTTPGISLISLWGHTLLRPYSIFPHPNSLAGYLLVSTPLIVFSSGQGRSVIDKVLKTVAIACSLICFILLFSKGAWLALGVGIVYLVYSKHHQLKLSNVLVLVVLIVLLSLFTTVFASVFLASGWTLSQSINDRLVLANVAGNIVAAHPLIGVGLNNFIAVLPSVVTEAGRVWLLQPVHNLFLLLSCETGFIGLVLFLFLLWSTCKKLLLKGNRVLVLVVVFILVTGLFDHYWLTLQQNLLLASLILGLSNNQDLI